MTDPGSGASPNAFVEDKPGTKERDRAEGRIEDLRQQGGIFVEAVRVTRMPMAVTDPTLPGDPIVFANEAFLTLSGYAMEEVLGQQPHFMNGPDTDPDDARQFREALERDEDIVIETVQYRKDGSPFVAAVFLTALQDEEGRTRNHFLSYLDISRRVEAERTVREHARETEQRAAQAVRDLNDRHREILESISDAFYAVDRDWRFTYVNRMAEQWWGRDRHDLLGKVYWEEFPEAVGSKPYEAHLQAASTREVVRLEALSPIPGRWVDIAIFPAADGGLSVYFRDISEKKGADARLRESEERYRLIVENARGYGIFLIDREGIITDWYKGAEAVFGWSREEAVGQAAEVTYTPEDQAEGVPRKEREQAAAQGWAPNVRWHVRKDGGRVFIDGIATALRNVEGDLVGFLKIGQDVTERKRAEEHERTLLAELQHRVRNTLGVIRSIARRTAATSECVEEMSMHLEGRIGAFSRVQSVVTRNPEAGVDLAAMIEDELLAHAAREGEGLKIEGPDVQLQARPAETVSLAIHELATNAVKYGALSSESGTISVTWERVRRDGGEDLELVWEENGVDGTPAEPGRQGFGLELLQRSLPYELDARTEVEFRPEGLRFRMSVPLGERVLAG